MLSKLKYMPVALSGLALGIYNLGVLWSLITNLLFPVYFFTVISLFLLIKIVLKNIFHFKHFLEELKNPIIGSFIPTLSMAIMGISSITKNLELSKYFWFIGFLLHIIFLISFIYYRVILKDYYKFIPSWFIPPIGLVVSVISGEAFGFSFFTKYILYSAMLLLIIMFPIMIYRIIFLHIMKKNIMPTFAIIGAPINLCLAAYLSIPINHNTLLLDFLSITGLLSTLMVYLSIFHLKKLDFTPLFASYTFPLAIAGIAMFKYSRYLSDNMLQNSNLWYAISLVETFIATCMIFYIFYNMMKYVIKMFKIN
jgi:exfoliative toxin A/B